MTCVYVTGEDGAPKFVAAPLLTDEHMQQIIEPRPSAWWVCCSAAVCWKRAASIPCGRKSPCWPPSPPPPSRDGWPLESAPASTAHKTRLGLFDLLPTMPLYLSYWFKQGHPYWGCWRGKYEIIDNQGR